MYFFSDLWNLHVQCAAINISRCICWHCAGVYVSYKHIFVAPLRCNGKWKLHNSCITLRKLRLVVCVIFRRLEKFLRAALANPADTVLKVVSGYIYYTWLDIIASHSPYRGSHLLITRLWSTTNPRAISCWAIFTYYNRLFTPLCVNHFIQADVSRALINYKYQKIRIHL